VLAYVFWHWRRAEVESASYVERLIAFHEALRRAAPPGFQASATFRAGRAPWVSSDESFEDWYVTSGSASLDPLNDASVSGECRAPHDAAARAAAGGTAGLYRLRLGSAHVAGAREGRWLAKPAGMSYQDFYARLEPLAKRPGHGLWGRQMTLGPTPEFCLMGPEPTALPEGFDALARPLDPLWPKDS
jgi:hypothetical protein